MFKNTYPKNWREIANACKEAAGWKCIRCDHPNDLASGHVLTVHHLNGDKALCEWWNLLALCQRCHLHFQGKVRPENPFMFEHTEWFKPYAAGFYAWKYKGVLLTREEVEEQLADLLKLEQLC